MREDNIQAQCFKWHWNTFHEERMQLYHNYNNPPNNIKGAQLKAMGLLRGVADFTYLTTSGKLVYIELKTATGKQTKDQALFQRRVESLGHHYHIIRSFEEFQQLIKSYQNGHE